MTRKQQTRRRIIIAQLCELSRNGWRNAKPCDYLPLEAELRELEGRQSGYPIFTAYDPKRIQWVQS